MSGLPETIGGFIENFQAAYQFVILITRDSPIGLWSAVSALVISPTFGHAMRHWFPKRQRRVTCDFLVELVVLSSSVLVAWLPWQTLNGLLVGVVCGFAAPFFWKGADALLFPLWVFAKRRLGVDDVDTRRRYRKVPRETIARGPRKWNG